MNIKLTLYRYRKSAFSLLLLSLLSVTSMAVDAARTYKPIPQTPPIVDPTLNNDFPSVNDRVNAIVGTADNKTVIGGAFTLVGGQSRPYIARLNADGTLDKNYKPTINFIVNALAIQSDGKLLIGGQFTSVNGIKRSRIARLNIDGSLDRSFNATVSGSILDIAIQDDGEIWIGGSFSFVNGSQREHLARLKADGSLSGITPNVLGGAVMAIAIEDDGQILIGGKFSEINSGSNSVRRLRLARFNYDGVVDMGFDPRPNSFVESIVVQPDGDVLVGGHFTSIVNSWTRQYFARLKHDGTLANERSLGLNGAVLSIALQSDGRIILGGLFTKLGTFKHNHIVRVLPDLGLDFCFVPDTNGGINEMAIGADGSLLLGGEFNVVNGSPQERISRLDTTCRNLDETFMLPTVFSADDSARFPTKIHKSVLQPNGKMIIVGRFSEIDGERRNAIARLNSDGRLDTTFVGPSLSAGSLDTYVHDVFVQTDGSILIVGNFTMVNQKPQKYVARVDTFGNLDESFVPPVFFNFSNSNPFLGAIRSVAQVNEKILLGGKFRPISGQQGLIRLNNDGSFDNSFNAGLTHPNMEDGLNVSKIRFQSDGKFLISGAFHTVGGVNGTLQRNIARFNLDGSFDNSFDNFFLGTDEISHLEVHSDDSVMVKVWNNSPSFGSLHRLTPNGDLDSSFRAARISGGGQGGLEIQADGKVLLGGNFITTGDSLRGGIARLNVDGSLDKTFFDYCVSYTNNNREVPGTISTFTVLPDGKVFIGGNFEKVGGKPRNRAARLIVD